jgi:hypothetical protein
MAYGYPTSNAARQAQLRMLNQGAGDVADRNAAQMVASSPNFVPNPALPISQVPADRIRNARVANINNVTTAQRAAAQPQAPRQVSLPRLGGSGGGGGGGGGGGAAAPTMSQAMLDWLAGLLRGGAPVAQTAGLLDLPDYAGMPMRAFDPTMFNQARTALGQGVQTDLGTAQTATQNMLDFLNTNYTNAFNNPNLQYATAGQAPGMDQQAMYRLLSSQGVNPSMNQGFQGAAQGAAAADQGFGNLWRTLAANEDLAQRGRIANATQYGTQAQQAIQAAGRAGNLGIDLGQGQAQAAWQQAADERAYQDYQLQQQLAQQEALQNWQRANQVADANATATNAYRGNELSALLGLVPQLVQAGGLNLPSLQSLGLAA